MAAKLSANTTAASVSVVRARASISVAGLSAVSSAITPAADVAYVLLTLDAVADTSGRFKYLPELVVVSDELQKLVQKAAQDSVSLSDVVTLSTTLGVSDSISFSEAFLATLVYVRDFVDSVAAADQHTLAVDKMLADTVSLTEALQYAFVKFLADGVSMNDSFAATDGLLYAFSKYTSNIVFVQDTATLYPSKVFSDMISAQDAGSLRSQGYCDFSYFAEDYVGASRTF